MLFFFPVMQTQKGKSDHEAPDVSSWVSVCPKGLCMVERRRTQESGPKLLPKSADQCMIQFVNEQNVLSSFFICCVL